MTFEERIERLTERHDAMAQSLELWIATSREQFGHHEQWITSHEQRITSHEQWITSHEQLLDRHQLILEQNSLDLGHLDAKIERLTDKIDVLASIALSHESRIGQLEGGAPVRA